MKLLRRRETKEVFAGKFVKTNTKQKRQSKLRTSAIVSSYFGSTRWVIGWMSFVLTLYTI